jgi:hypothetical protein
MLGAYAASAVLAATKRTRAELAAEAEKSLLSSKRPVDRRRKYPNTLILYIQMVVEAGGIESPARYAYRVKQRGVKPS